MSHDDKTRISVAAVVCQGTAVLLAQRTGEGSMAWRWELPGGKCEAGEAPVPALEREFLEEFNLPAVVGAELARDSFENKGVWHELLAFAVQADMAGAELREHLAWRFFEPGQLPPRRELVDSDARILDKLGYPTR